jgi:TPR repeat protein
MSFSWLRCAAAKRMRSMARSLFACLAVTAIQSLAAIPAHAQSAVAPVTTECLRLNAAKVDWSNSEAADKHRKIWLESCRQAYAQNGDDPKIKIALARALRDRAQSVPLLRAAVAQDDTEAMLLLFNDFNSFDRNPNRPDVIARAEAERALRRAAELGNAEATFRLATILRRGGPIRHDLAGARYWGEKALANPPKDMSPRDVQILVGQWLSESDNADERRRGIALLEPLAQAGRGDAQAYLAVAIRRDDPVRARKLLESAARTYPGSALAPLSAMLIAGEGGPKDEKRALSLLQGWRAADAQHAKWALGQLVLEGRLIRRDVAAAVKLLGPWSQWDYPTRLQIVRLVSENPDVKIEYPNQFLYRATEDAELGEPGAMEALIALKLSSHAQFADQAGGCALAKRVSEGGDAAARRHAEKCVVR